MGLNYTALSGNVTRDPEMRTTPGGTSILQVGLAFNDRRKNPQTQQWEDVPNYIDVIIFGNRAEAMSRILTKGMHIAVQGKLRWSSWEDKNGGGRRSKIELMADEIDLMSPRQGNAPQAAPAPQYALQQRQQYANPPQQQMAPQMAPQQPTAPTPPQGYGYQQQMPQPPAQPQMPQQDEFYDESIPF